jgi:M6 family metalloprotease-like protein
VRGRLIRFLALGALLAACAPARAAQVLPVRRVAGAADVARLLRAGRPAPAPMTEAQWRLQGERERRWRSFDDVLSAPGADWSLRARRRAGWRPRATPAPRTARTAGTAAAAWAEPETIRVAFIRIDFAADRGGSASTGDGRFDLSVAGPDAIPIDPPPHNRTFFGRHLEALSRYYDAMSYHRVVVEGDVWPREETAAYSLADMADYGPWTFSQTIYGEALRMFRDMFFAADSQSTLRGDRIPWDSYDRFYLVHAGSDLQNDVFGDSPEDLPSFTITTADSEAVIFPDSLNLPIDRATILPELGAQDGYYGAINGVIVHESGHNLFGLADLYDVETGYPVVGYWSLMDSGNLLGSLVQTSQGEIYATGLLPPSVDPWQRAFLTDALGFPEVDYGGAPMAIADVERHPDVRRVTLSGDEYLLLENRYLAPADTVELDQDSLTRVILGPKRPDRFEYDALLPGAGILAWHVDESVIPYSTSLRINPDYGFNTNPERLGVSVLEADGLSDLGDTGSPYLFGAPFDPWFLGNNPVLSDSTFPNLVPHTGARPHRRLDFLDEPGATMHVAARRTWEPAGWPVEAKFPPGGPLLLAVDADGDGRLDVCWAGGPDSTVRLADSSIVHVADADSAALFAVRADGRSLDGTTEHAFAWLDRRPRPEMAAVPVGVAGAGPAYFAVSTYAAGADTSSPGGRVLLLDHLGVARPGWPPVLPSVVVTPPVIAGSYPDALVFVGCADGFVYALGLDGAIAQRAEVVPASGGTYSGRLAITAAGPGGACWRVAAGTDRGWVGTALMGSCAIPAAVGWPVRVREDSTFTPDMLWLALDGADGAGAAGGTCGAGVTALVVHAGDRLWAFCPDGTGIPGWGHAFSDTLVAGLGVGDPDGDGLPDVLAQDVRAGLYFVNRTGYPSPGWPRKGLAEDLRTWSPPLALDVDGDGRSEVVGLNGSGVVAALRADGAQPEGWPLASGSGASGSPVAADLDADGMLELVVPDRFHRLFAYSLPAAAPAAGAIAWTMLGGDAGRSSAFALTATPVAPAAAAGPLVRGSLKAYPNPARQRPVRFAYRLTEPADVEFRILDTSGHEVASFSRPGLQGENVQVWEPGDVPAGLYLARLRFRGAASERVEVMQVGLLR